MMQLQQLVMLKIQHRDFEPFAKKSMLIEYFLSKLTIHF